jgi:hypothetical protein
VIAAGFAIAGVSGTASTISQGDETVTGDANVYPTGVAGTSALGTLTLVTNNVIAVTTDALTSGLGSLTITGIANITLTGVVGTGGITSVLVWGEIDSSQDPSWSGVSDSQDPNWTDIAA